MLLYNECVILCQTCLTKSGVKDHSHALARYYRSAPYHAQMAISAGKSGTRSFPAPAQNSSEISQPCRNYPTLLRTASRLCPTLHWPCGAPAQMCGPILDRRKRPKRHSSAGSTFQDPPCGQRRHALRCLRVCADCLAAPRALRVPFAGRPISRGIASA